MPPHSEVLYNVHIGLIACSGIREIFVYHKEEVSQTLETCGNEGVLGDAPHKHENENNGHYDMVQFLDEKTSIGTKELNAQFVIHRQRKQFGASNERQTRSWILTT